MPQTRLIPECLAILVWEKWADVRIKAADVTGFDAIFVPQGRQMRSRFFVLAKLSGGRRTVSTLTETKQRQDEKDASRSNILT